MESGAVQEGTFWCDSYKKVGIEETQPIDKLRFNVFWQQYSGVNGVYLILLQRISELRHI